MKHYLDITSIKTRKITEANLSFVECDDCGKKIFASGDCRKDRAYFKVHTWHDDWGNDSCESHMYYEFCRDCAIKHVSDYIRNMSGSMQLECAIKHASIYDRSRKEVIE